MRHKLSSVLLPGLAVFLVGCGSPDSTDATSSSTTITTLITTTSSTTTTTISPTTTTTTTSAETTTTASSGLPGDPIIFGPVAGDIVAVVGVAHDDVLNLRAAPGANQEIVAEIPPHFSDLTAVGSTRQLSASMWIAVDYEGTQGWVNLRYIAYLGATNDVTAEVVARLGENPVAGDMLELGLLVAESLGSDLPTDQVVSGAPTTGDPGEVTIDVTGSEDDSVRGGRIRVFGQRVDDGYCAPLGRGGPVLRPGSRRRRALRLTAAPFFNCRRLSAAD